MGKVAYDADFYGWTQEQASLLRAGQLAELDVEHLTDEIESMGRSERRQLTNRFELLLIHLLKWHSQPDLREIDGKSWLTWQFPRKITLTILDAYLYRRYRSND